ncbi:MAG: signal peptidase I [Microbacteriaceae bacterium]
MTDEQTMPTRPDPVRRDSRGRRRGIKYFLRDILIIFVIAVLVSFLVKTFLIRSFYIPSGSMEQTLQINDRIIVNELEPKLMPIQHGDVVVFRDPGGWLQPQPHLNQNPVAAGVDWALSIVGLSAPDSDDHLIKRVIGLPGDHVTCCNALGQMSVNGIPLKEPYVALPPGVAKVSNDPFDVTVPKGSLWVMGDNRYNSADSRYNRTKPGKGFVPIDNVVGRALVITWPIARWSWLDNYSSAFRGVERAGE